MPRREVCLLPLDLNLRAYIYRKVALPAYSHLSCNCSGLVGGDDTRMTDRRLEIEADFRDLDNAAAPEITIKYARFPGFI